MGGGLLAFALGGPETAYADCAPAAANGATVTCTGTTTSYDAGTFSKLTVNVAPGASVFGFGGLEAVKITNPSGNPANKDTLNNFGLIDGPVTFLGVTPTNNLINYGILQLTDPTLNLQTNYSISGGFEQKASGSLALRFDSNFFNDNVLALAGVLKLDGKLILVPQPGLYNSGAFTNTYLSTGGFGTVSGTFSSVTVASPFFTATTTYGATNVSVEITPLAFNAVQGLTINQQSVANAVQTGFQAGLLGALGANATTFYSNLFASNSVAVFDALSGEGTAAAQTAAFQAGSLFNNTMTNQNAFWRAGEGFGPAATSAGAFAYAPQTRAHPAFAGVREPEQPAPFRAWVAGFGGRQTIDAETSPGSASLSATTGGGAFGGDRQVSRDLLLGFAVGGSSSSFSVADRATSGTLAAGHAGVYGTKLWGPLYLSGSLNYAHFENETTRSIAGVGPTESVTGKFGSDQFGGRVEVGHRIALAPVTVTPFAAIEFSELWQQGYTETSTQAGGAPGILGLSYGSRLTSSLPLFVGTQIDARVAMTNGMAWAPFARVSWVHEFMPNREIDASLVSLPTPAFTVAGARAASDAARISGGTKLFFSERAYAFANVDGEFSDRSTSVSGSGGVKVTW